MPNFLSAWVANRRAIRELTRLSDRELADCGIERDHIQTVVARAAARAAAGTSTMAPSWGQHNRRSLAI